MAVKKPICNYGGALKELQVGDTLPSAGVTAFTGLSDVPASYATHGLKVVRVNAGETALEFVTLAGGGDMLAANNLGDVLNTATARTNLGLGTAAVQNVGAFFQVANDLSECDPAIAQVHLALSTKAEFNTACSDGNFLYVGDITQYTDELAQDAVGAMIDGSLTYVDATPLLQRSALTGAITASAGSNTTALGSFTKAQLDGAVSDGNVLYVGDVTQYTDELAQDAVGAMVDTTLSYDDATPALRVVGLRTTTGPTNLVAGAIADGEFLKRVGSTLVGATPTSATNYGQLIPVAMGYGVA